MTWLNDSPCDWWVAEPRQILPTLFKVEDILTFMRHTEIFIIWPGYISNVTFSAADDTATQTPSVVMKLLNNNNKKINHSQFVVFGTSIKWLNFIQQGYVMATCCDLVWTLFLETNFSNHPHQSSIMFLISCSLLFASLVSAESHRSKFECWIVCGSDC